MNIHYLLLADARRFGTINRAMQQLLDGLAATPVETRDVWGK